MTMATKARAGARERKKTADVAARGQAELHPDLLRRVVIEAVRPQVDGGRFPIKRVVGEEVVVTADIFADGHDVLAAVLLYRRAGEADWREAPLELVENDGWRGRFVVESLGRYEYTIEGWIDRFESWRHEHMRHEHGEIRNPVLPGLIHRHGVRWRGRLKADGKEDDLFVGMLAGDVQGV